MASHEAATEELTGRAKDATGRATAEHAPPHLLLQLQAAAGNRAVSGLFRRHPLETARPEFLHSAQGPIVPAIQRQVSDKDVARIERLRPFSVVGGLNYTAAERRHAKEGRQGLLLTSAVLGLNEKQLQKVAPPTIAVGKELDLFGGGRLGHFVDSYNEFAVAAGELLHGVGRIQDLVQTGAPLFPENMSAAQKKGMRPTDDTNPGAERKTALDTWKSANTAYARAVDDRVGAPERVSQGRRAFWNAQAGLEAELKRARATLGASNPGKFKVLEVEVNDLVSVLVAGFEGGPSNAAKELGLTAVGKVLSAPKKREDWDKQVAQHKANLEASDAVLANEAQKLIDAGRTFHFARIDLMKAGPATDAARHKKRKDAAMFGQYSAPVSEKRNNVLAEIRMPLMMADAYDAAAVGLPRAERALQQALKAEPTVKKALIWYRNERARADKYKRDSRDSTKQSTPYFHDITSVRDAYVEVKRWPEILELLGRQVRAGETKWKAFIEERVHK